MTTATVSYDSGLRSFMLKVYNWMTLGLVLTGGVAWAMFTSGATVAMLASPVMTWAVILSPFAALLGMWLLPRDPMVHGALFLALAAAMGASMSTIFLTYKLGLIAQAFFATAVGFAGTSLFGYTTKIDMSGLGSFFTIALFGMLGLLILNMFIVSTVFTLAVSFAGVLLFAGLTAYDTQKIKDLYYQGYGDDVMAISGALELYLDFVNMFLYILRIMGIFSSDD
jgi:hypothetical protein